MQKKLGLDRSPGLMGMGGLSRGREFESWRWIEHFSQIFCCLERSKVDQNIEAMDGLKNIFILQTFSNM